MKESISNANFPRDEEDRVYHISVKVGEVANRVITVGDHVRARRIAKLLDSEEECGHPIFEKQSQRGFLTITGRYKGVPVTIMAIGMGNPMMDFFVRETRASVEGELAIIRFGSCGSITHLAPPGAVIVPSAGYCIRRNIDYFADEPLYPELKDKPYLFSGHFKADEKMVEILSNTLKSAIGVIESESEYVGPVLTGGLNVDGCSFYSSQGRFDPTFWDDNQDLLKEVALKFPKTHSIEMETSMLFHLAHCAKDPKKPIKAAGCMQVFADRLANGFIQPEVVALLEPVVGKACLDALIQIDIENEMSPEGTVWECKK
ncbi:nucleoside phosphorylase domain-containing protein [Cokeromyces recurvatus]|uniref:nucleoside phosphorylase domain-containing protein n=1 Tax=Cokeromyces recurvatus TaxID=90255 RepID=UPI002220EDE9|nr:nucleoside phosphorylase domain-containing protein [Cokeromyces recurvatus]KAI7903983.1 nucleoside phosphorylase domain-containing protein [Cokeromyces recurvatus]